MNYNYEFHKEIEEFCDGLKSGKYKTKTLKAEYSISEDEIQEFRSNWKKLQQMQHNRPMNFFDKLSYGFYWFNECFTMWYDTVMLGYYDEDEQPSWEFFNHINCNYPLTYRMTTGKK